MEAGGQHISSWSCPWQISELSAPLVWTRTEALFMDQLIDSNIGLLDGAHSNIFAPAKVIG